MISFTLKILAGCLTLLMLVAQSLLFIIVFAIIIGSILSLFK